MRRASEPPARVPHVFAFAHRVRRDLPEPPTAKEPIRLLLRSTEEKVLIPVVGAPVHPQIEEVGLEVEGQSGYLYLAGAPKWGGHFELTRYESDRQGRLIETNNDSIPSGFQAPLR